MVQGPDGVPGSLNAGRDVSFPVSYTHLDVYKRQAMAWVMLFIVGTVTVILFKTKKKWVFSEGE